MYYFNILFLWIVCIVFTLYCCSSSGKIGLCFAILICSLLIPCGILCIRTCLELAFSIIVIKDKFKSEEVSLLQPKELKGREREIEESVNDPEENLEEEYISEEYSEEQISSPEEIENTNSDY